jgi:hypothetical protein
MKKVLEFPNGSKLVFEDTLYGLPYYESMGEFTWLGIEREDKMHGQQLGRSYAMTEADSPSSGEISVRKETELRITELEKQLAIQKEMKKLLDENPVIEKFMNLSRGIL